MFTFLDIIWVSSTTRISFFCVKLKQYGFELFCFLTAFLAFFKKKLGYIFFSKSTGFDWNNKIELVYYGFLSVKLQYFWDITICEARWHANCVCIIVAFVVVFPLIALWLCYLKHLQPCYIYPARIKQVSTDVSKQTFNAVQIMCGVPDTNLL